MTPMDKNQQVLYDIATDPEKARKFFMSLGVQTYIHRLNVAAAFVCGVCVGFVIGVVR